SELKSKLTRKLQMPFQDAVNRWLTDGTTPPGVGWVLIRKSTKLFLLSDLHVAGEANPIHGRAEEHSALSTEHAVPIRTESYRAPTPTTSTSSKEAFESAFADAFASLDRQAGGHNFVSLVELRGAVPVGRERFDVGLRELRVAGQFTLSAAEGRHGIK